MPFGMVARSFQTGNNVVWQHAMSGWGATVYIIEKDKITERTLKTRMD